METPLPNPERRKRRLMVAAAVVAALAAGFSAYEFFYARYHVTTDNAYVGGNVVNVSPRMAGTVTAIHVEDNHPVKAGDLLVELDAADARIELMKAEAQLSSTLRNTRALFSSTAGMRAQVEASRANLLQAKQQFAQAEADRKRREEMSRERIVSQEDAEHAREAAENALARVRSAEAALDASERQYAASLAQIEGTDLRDHPAVALAAAQVKEKFLDYKRTRIVAPVDGFVTKRVVQLGGRVEVGSPLLAIAPLHEAWVDANFKETQLERLRAGQPVTLTTDLYGSSVKFHGKVQGLSSGTGAAFALLPAQNATGNWIKVVQRLPVRITLDPAELKEHPLRMGLSTEVDVDVHGSAGTPLSVLEGGNGVRATTIYAADEREATRHVAEVIAAATARRESTGNAQ